MVIQTGCHALQPLFHDLYPSLYSSPESLHLSSAQLSAIAAANPRLAECALKGTSSHFFGFIKIMKMLNLYLP